MLRLSVRKCLDELIPSEMSHSMAKDNPMKPRRFEKHFDPNTIVRTKKTKKREMVKGICLVSYWKIMGPLVAEEIAGSNYLPIPYCIDTNAYNIGFIFIQTTVKIRCLRPVSVLKVLGPIREFILESESDREWSEREFHAIKSSGDLVDFKVIVEAGENSMSFAGYNYYFLDKADDMLAVNNVTIDRSSDENLSTAKWFGLITNVVVASSFEVRITNDLRERILRVGDSPHTLLFKYEVCRLNARGTVVKVSSEKIRCEWLPLDSERLDRLPLPQLELDLSRNS